jgi:4-nitrophenyl phosphatase
VSGVSYLESIDVLVVDLDGVVWIGGKAIEANVRALRRLQEHMRIYYVTNNSTKSRPEYASKLRSLGLEAWESNVITSGRAATLWLKRFTKARNVYLIGEEGLKWELEVEGYHVVDRGLEAEAVVVGLDRRLTYHKLAEALKALLRGAYFIATNPDHILPEEETPIPGAGAIIAALETASKRKPDVIAGKPNPWILVSTLGDIDYSRVAVVGDRVDTDVELALRIGAKPILTLTGVTRNLDEETLRRLREANAIVVKDLGELLAR